jgi:hypothetical protein
MTEITPALLAETTCTEVTRFNALRGRVLSRYSVLPRKNASDYEEPVAALVAEHVLLGPQARAHAPPCCCASRTFGGLQRVDASPNIELY